jgi:biopolymer transport protein ExbB/TolQ/phage host-nuclease inhibitor protein Gam
MSAKELQTKFQPQDHGRQANWFLSLASSPIIWGTAATVAFYALIPILPLQREFAQRYFCSHWILYATTWLFAMGMAILIVKSLVIPRERSAFAFNLVRNPNLRQETDQDRRREFLERSVASLPPGIQRSELARRYSDVCEYLAARRGTVSLEDHLKYLHEVAGERLHDSYALIRTITWAIPILGFLGTVIGITMAIANITPDQLEKSMSEITGGLAVAFDTTALSLSLSMILVFVSFIVERAEQQILGRVEVSGMREIAPLLASHAPTDSPLLQAEQHAAAQMLDRTEKLIQWQTNLWQESLDGLRVRWEQVVQQQQMEFTQVIQTGLQATLTQHNQELSEARHELSESFTKLSTELITMVTTVQEQSQLQQTQISSEITSLWGEVQSELRLLRDEQTNQVENLVHSFSDEVLSWQTDLKASTHATTGQVRELQSQGETLLKIVGEEAELSRLQSILANNLEAIRAVETFEKALHSLTAAVHMLTIKNRAA